MYGQTRETNNDDEIIQTLDKAAVNWLISLLLKGTVDTQ